MEEILDTSTVSISDLNLFSFPDSTSCQLMIYQEPTKKEQRETLMLEIYNYYLGEKDERRKENWKRYISYLKSNYIDEKKLGREKTYRKFLRTKTAIKEFDLDRLTFHLKFMPLRDLPYMVSTGREFAQSKKNFTAWLSTFIFAKK